MPLYDYTCPSCGHSFTIRQSFADAPEAACPGCGTSGRRRLSVPSVVYKGSGFYSTDHGRRSGATPAEGPGVADRSAPSEAGHDGASAAPDSPAHGHPH